MSAKEVEPLKCSYCGEIYSKMGHVALIAMHDSSCKEMQAKKVACERYISKPDDWTIF